MSNLATSPRDLKSLINSDNMRRQFALALPKHLTSERFCRIAITALSRTPKLQECTPESLMKCLLDLSAMGIEPDGRRAHLIPFRDNRNNITECQLIVDYKGLAELIMRSGTVSVIHADKICLNDSFIFDRGEIKEHAIDFRSPRGPAYAYYALVKLKDGSEKAEVMDVPEIQAIRDRSQGYKAAIKYNKDHPWITDFDEMAKKTVFKRASKWLPLSPEFRDAVEKDEEEPRMRNITPEADPLPRLTIDPFENAAPMDTEPAPQTATQESLI